MILKKIEQYLKEGGIEEAKAEARLIVESISGLSIEELLLGRKVADEVRLRIEETAKKRVQTKAPIQHILSFAYFMSQKFLVNEDVLIPRDETEILVREAIEAIRENDLKTVLDIGTGSGNIACSIALKCPGVQVLGVDISVRALSVAIENAQELNLINHAIFRKSDVFSNVKEKFDLIVSNPPYIPLLERESLEGEVNFDPELALFAKDDEGLEFYEKIITGASEHLNPCGHVFFEVGQSQAPLVQKIFLENNFVNVKIIKDLVGIERVIGARLSQ